MNISTQPLRTVSSVDLKRYAGRWYEIARYPNRFERRCASDITAEYFLRDDGKIRVVNSCLESGGRRRESIGSAKAVDSTNAKLKVTFFWPFSGDYWIIDLDQDYRYAVVSEPKRKYLWILSRTSQMNRAQWSPILERLRELGFDPARLIMPKQVVS